MKNRLAIILFLGTTIFIFACKKKDTTPAAVTPVNTAPPADGSPSTATSFYGIFTTGSYTDIAIGGGTSAFSQANAYFSSQAVPAVYATSSVKVNTVSLNGDTLMYFPTLKYYTINNPTLTTELWSVNGANGIATFSFSNNVVVPSYSVASNLPDSISKAAGFTIIINNVSNNTSAYISILDGTNTANGFYNVNLSSGNNTITISAANLALLSTTSSGAIGINVANAKAFVFSGKDYQFVRETECVKTIKIKP